jgi:hypothetical protein
MSKSFDNVRTYDNTRAFDIYFSDLKEETQKEYLKFLNIDTSDEANLNLTPIAMVEIDD